MTLTNEELNIAPAVRDFGEENDLDLSWLDTRGEWGVKADPGKGGLTLSDIELGSYGEPGDQSNNLTGRPRGSVPRPDAYRVGRYQVRSKSDIWLSNASVLYLSLIHISEPTRPY